MSTQPRVAADIESLCSKCGDVWHVVVAMDKGQVVKVQCKQCGGYHRYRPLKASQRGTVGPTRRRAELDADGNPVPNAAKTPREPRERSAGAKPPANAAMVPADLGKPAKPYRPREPFLVGERIDHPTFGTGVVEALPSPGKMQVFFPVGRKLLVCGTTGSGATGSNASTML